MVQQQPSKEETDVFIYFFVEIATHNLWIYSGSCFQKLCSSWIRTNSFVS